MKILNRVAPKKKSGVESSNGWQDLIKELHATRLDELIDRKVIQALFPPFGVSPQIEQGTTPLPKPK